MVLEFVWVHGLSGPMRFLLLALHPKGVQNY